MSIVPAQCRACVHLHAEDDMGNGSPEPGPMVISCSAFPLAIPLAIGLGADHRQAFLGDRGVRFKLGPSDEQRSAFDAWLTTFGGEPT